MTSFADRRVSVAAWGVLFAAAAYVATVIASASATPGYSHRTQLLSELGEVGAPAAAAMRAMLIAVGTITLLFAFTVRRKRGFDTWLGCGSLVALGGGLVLGGVFPCDPTCAPVSLAGWAHILTSIPAMLGSLVAPFAFGARMRDRGWRGRAAISFVFGALSIVSLVAAVLLFPRWGCPGIGQRIATALPLGWVGFLAYCVLPDAAPDRWPAGPSVLPALRLLRERRRPLELAARLARDFDGIVGVRFLGIKLCVVWDPALLEELFVRRASSIRQGGLSQFGPVLGRGLLTSEGALWRRQRRLIQPLFRKSVLARYDDAIVGIARRATATWNAGDVVDMHAQGLRAFTRISTAVLFGTDSARVEDLVADTQHRLMRHFERAVTGLPIPLRIPTPANVRVLRAVRQLDAAIHGLIASRRAAPDLGDDFLGALLAARDEHDRPLDDALVRDECITMLLAATETTGVVLAWTMHLLASHPELAADVARAIDRVVGAATPTSAHLHDLPELTHAIHEAMRLYTPVWAIARVAIEDCALGPYVLPAGTAIVALPLLAHHDGNVFDEPLQFRPERWASRCPHQRASFRPFGAGPRKCIGADLAMQEVGLLAVIILRQFALRACDPPVPQASVALRPRDGVRIQLCPR